MLNAFTMVRPKGKDAAPAKPPKRTNHSAAPKSGNVHLLLDSRGRKTVDIAPRTKGAIVVEGQTKTRAEIIANNALYDSQRARVKRGSAKGKKDLPFTD